MEAHRDAAVQAARAAGKLMVEGRSSAHIEAKTQLDIVTDVDKLCEKTVIDILLGSFPGYAIIAEECAPAQSLSDSPTWIIDPIDGTLNFVQGYNFSAVSIALAINKRPVVGVILNPFTNELYVAVEGQGATLNGVPIRVSQQQSLSGAVITTNVGPSVRERPAVFQRIIAMFSDVMLTECRGIRMNGSAALQLAQVACGKTDVFYEEGISIWDIAAGVLLVREAGGAVCDLAEQPYSIVTRRVVGAACEQLARELQGLTKAYYDEEE